MKALSFLKTKIGQRFVVILLVVSVIPVGALGWFAIRRSERALRRQTFAMLRAASDGAEAALREFLASLKERTLELSRDERILEILGSLPESGPDSAAAARLAGLLESRQQSAHDLQELFLMSTKGRIVASSNPKNVGRDAGSAEYFARGRNSFFPGDVLHDPNDGQIAWVLAAPVREFPSGKLIGVLGVRVNPQVLSDLASGQRVLAQGADTQSFRIGQTGETYIVNRNRFMITNSRELSNAVLRVRVDTLPVRAAFERKQELTADYTDYRGVEVSGASVILQDLGWVMLTEIDFSQAFGVFHHLRNGLIEIAAVLSISMLLLAWYSSRRILLPIQMLQHSDRALARGDETGAIVSEKGLPNDEIGELVRRRNMRVKTLAATQRQLEDRTAKLQNLVAEMEQVSYSIVHDMRAPLRAITSFGELIAATEAERLSPESREFLGRMQAAATRMDELIRDILSYNSMVLGDLAFRRVDVAKLLRVIIQTYPILLRHKDHISFPQNLPPVWGNDAALAQCLSNLLHNAVKFVAPGQIPRVQVDAERREERVRIWIQDNGIGIPQPLLKRIFEIFQQGSKSSEGTGIGLAIVRKAVEKMHGTIGVESKPGEGSRFWIELRAAIGDEAPSSLTHGPTSSLVTQQKAPEQPSG